jgi:PAS domain S-box-containing protein
MREFEGNQMPSKATRFESLLEAVPDALVGMDQKGVIRFVNRQTESLFCYDRDQLIGQPIGTLIPEPLWEIYAENRDQYFADPRTRSMGLDVELIGLHQDGTEFPIKISMAHIDTGDVLLVITAIADVTKRETAVKNAELIAAIVEASDDAITGSTLSGILTSWNPAAERMYGYSSQEVIGRSGNLLAPDDRDDEMAAILARIEDGEAVEHLEITLVRKDGSLVPVSLTVSPIRDEDGVVVGAGAVHRDVTEQRQAFETAQRMAAIVEGSEDAIISGSLDGSITSWNPAAETMYGYASAEVVGKPAKFLTPRDRKGEIQAVLAKIKAGQHVEHLETKRVRKDGTVFPVSLTVSPIRDAGGAVVGTSVIHRDLSEQRGALAAAQRIAAIVESSQEAIIGRTLDGIITSWNPAAERMFGYSGKEIVGRPIELLIPRDRAGERLSILARISAGRPVDNYETMRVRKDGAVFPVSLTVSPIRDENGTVVAASMVYHDVTELKHAAQYARSLIEADLDPLVTISPEGKITDVNEAAVKATGVARSKLIGTDFSHYFTDPDKAHQGYQRAFVQGSVTDYPLTLRRRDGTLTDVLYNASVYRDADGNVLGVFAAARDITRQKEAFEAAQRMAAIVEYSDDAIIGSTLEGIITSWNPAAERLYGYSSEKIVRRSVDLLSPKDRTGEIKAILAKISEGRPVDNFETICTRKDRTTFPVKLTVAPIRDAGGIIVGASVIARDMTEHEEEQQGHPIGE